jgi:hypothetical protein
MNKTFGGESAYETVHPANDSIHELSAGSRTPTLGHDAEGESKGFSYKGENSSSRFPPPPKGDHGPVPTPELHAYLREKSSSSKPIHNQDRRMTGGHLFKQDMARKAEHEAKRP